MFRVGEGGLVETNFQLLMLGSNFLKSKNPMFSVCVGEGGGGGNQFQTFDAESKFAKNFISFQAKKCLGMVFGL